MLKGRKGESVFGLDTQGKREGSHTISPKQGRLVDPILGRLGQQQLGEISGEEKYGRQESSIYVEKEFGKKGKWRLKDR